MPCCAAINCSRKDGPKARKNGFTFHRFPLKNEVLLQQWLQSMRREDYIPSKHAVLCSAHFKKECFYKCETRYKILPDAVPTEFDFPEYVQNETTSVECEGRRRSLRAKLYTVKNGIGRGKKILAPPVEKSSFVPNTTEIVCYLPTTSTQSCYIPSTSGANPEIGIAEVEVQTQKRDWSFLSKSVYTQWKQLGRMQGLIQDDEIATFLLKHFEDAQKKPQMNVMLCETCSNPLTISCLRCNWTIEDMTDATCLKSPLPPTVVTKEEGVDLDRNEGGGVGDESFKSEWPASDDDDAALVVQFAGATESKGHENDSIEQDKKPHNSKKSPQHHADDAGDNYDSDTDCEYDYKESINKFDNRLTQDSEVTANNSGTNEKLRDHNKSNPNETRTMSSQTKTEELGSSEEGGNEHGAEKKRDSPDSPTHGKEAGPSSDKTDDGENSWDHNYNRASHGIAQNQEASKSTVDKSTVCKDAAKPSGANAFQCNVCKKSYKYSRNLKTHMASHSARSFKCDVCNKLFHRAFLLRSHKQVHVKRPFACEVCCKSFMTEENLTAHKRVHNPFVCDMCKKIFTDPDKFQKHKERHEKDLMLGAARQTEKNQSDSETQGPSDSTNEKRFTCDLCNKSFSKPYRFRSHMATHNPARKKAFTCEQCGKCFANSNNLRRHQMIHSGLRPFVCTVCGKCFTQSYGLKIHMLIHTGEKPYVCEKCGRAFTQITSLKIHEETHTTGNLKPFMCDLCGKVFKRKASLKVHIQKAHAPPSRRPRPAKVFACEVCKKSFTAKSTLKIHMRIHTGEKPYVCNVCSRAFTNLPNYHRHKLVHSGVKPYQCDVCMKSFARVSTLKMHKITHTGLKPFKCPVCSKCFSDRSTLVKHKKTHLDVSQSWRSPPCYFY